MGLLGAFPFMKWKPQLQTRVLAVLACVASLSPYLLPVLLAKMSEPLMSWLEAKGDWTSVAIMFAGSGIWLTLVIATQISGGWARKLWWLWVLFPVAFGLQLFVLYMFIVVSLFGFAP